MDETDSLIALRLLFLVVRASAGLQTLLEVLQRPVEFIAFLKVNGDNLVHADQLARYLSFYLREAGLYRLFESGLQVIHRLEYIEDLLLTDTEALVGLGLALGVLSLDRDVQAALVEVGGRLPVVELLELLSHTQVLLETMLDVAFSLEVLSLLQFITQCEERVLGLLELGLPRTFIEPLLLLQPN